MKKLCVFFALFSIFCTLVAVSLCSGTIYGITKSGSISHFNARDEQVEGVGIGSYERIDLLDKTEALAILSRQNVKIVFTEVVEGILFYYCYTPDIIKYEKVQGQKVNLCIAIKSDGAVIGSPIIKGSV